MNNEEADYSKRRQASLQIPEFINSGNNSIAEEELVTLNNVPGNTEIEEINHLNKLDQVASNYKQNEWLKLLQHAPSKLLTGELQRRLSGFEVYRSAHSEAEKAMNEINL